MNSKIEQRSPGSWSFRVDVPGPDGKRQQRRYTVKGTRRDAERELARIVHELNTGAFVAPSKMTTGEWLEHWLSVKRSRIAARTWERYDQIVRNDLVPAIGAVPLQKLAPSHIEAMETAALTSGRRRGAGEGLSPRTIVHIHGVLRTALEHAVMQDAIPRNPADRVKPPRPTDREMHALDEEQTAQLFTAARQTPFFIAVVIASATGMRRGEIMGLRWEDVALDPATLAGSVTVRRATEVTRAGVGEKAPKTKKGRRVIPLPRYAVEELLRHKGRQAEAKLGLGPGYQDCGRVVTWADGSPMHPDYVTHAFRKLLLKEGLPRIRFHDLRHSHASQALTQGTEITVVSERLGHANPSITLNVYSHVLKGRHEVAAERMDEAMRRHLRVT